MATTKLTDKQKDKLKGSKYVRSNSDDVTVNKKYQESAEYDEEEGTLTYDKRTREGKEIDKILKSRNRKSLKQEDNDIWDDYDDSEETTDAKDLESKKDEADVELPELCSRYSGWDIWVEKDDAHKFKVIATLSRVERLEIVPGVFEEIDKEEIDRIEINGDEIDADVETYVTDKIDEREEERAEARDWNKYYASYMGLDEDPDWEESYNID